MLTSYPSQNGIPNDASCPSQNDVPYDVNSKATLSDDEDKGVSDGRKLGSTGVDGLIGNEGVVDRNCNHAAVKLCLIFQRNYPHYCLINLCSRKGFLSYFYLRMAC